VENGEYTENPGRVIGAAFGALLLTTPEHYNGQTTRAQALEALEKAASAPSTDANDKVRQVQAMLAMDVSRHAGGSLERAAAAVRARTLVIVASADHVVTPGPALEFAGLIGARTLVLDSACGHLASSCQAGLVNEAVAEFLER
jgi:homoserine O-acetyltransferase/O-succinyltransferase